MQKTAAELRENIALIERTLSNTPDKNSDMAKAMARNLVKYKAALSEVEAEKKNVPPVQAEQPSEVKPDNQNETGFVDSLKNGFKAIIKDARDGKSFDDAIQSGQVAAGLVGK